MPWSESDTLRIIAAYFPDALTNSELSDKLARITNQFPNVVSSYYIECRLGASSTQLDFSACITAPHGRKVLSDRGYLSSADDFSIPSAKTWKRIETFCTEWAHPASPFFTAVPLIWLEFDHAERLSDTASSPGIVISLGSKLLNDDTLGSHREEVKHRYALTRRALAILYEESVLGSTEGVLRGCFDALPEGGQMLYASAMLSREPAVIKLCGRIMSAQLPEYLKLIGWPGSYQDLGEVVEMLDPTTRFLRYDLSINSRLEPTLGIELLSDNHDKEHDERARILRRAVEIGLCTSDQASALLAWDGYSREIYPEQSWPTRLTRTWYMKLVLENSGRLLLKAYLGFTPALFSPFSFA